MACMKKAAKLEEVKTDRIRLLIHDVYQYDEYVVEYSDHFNPG